MCKWNYLLQKFTAKMFGSETQKNAIIFTKTFVLCISFKPNSDCDLRRP